MGHSNCLTPGQVWCRIANAYNAQRISEIKLFQKLLSQCIAIYHNQLQSIDYDDYLETMYLNILTFKKYNNDFSFNKEWIQSLAKDILTFLIYDSYENYQYFYSFFSKFLESDIISKDKNTGYKSIYVTYNHFIYIINCSKVDNDKKIKAENVVFKRVLEKLKLNEYKISYYYENLTNGLNERSHLLYKFILSATSAIKCLKKDELKKTIKILEEVYNNKIPAHIKKRIKSLENTKVFLPKNRLELMQYPPHNP